MKYVCIRLKISGLVESWVVDQKEYVTIVVGQPKMKNTAISRGQMQY